MKTLTKTLALLFVVINLLSCTPDSPAYDDYQPVATSYDGYALEFKEVFDSYRLSINEPILTPELKLTQLALEHCIYMDSINEINNYNFYYRCQQSRAYRVGEFCAYNYQSAQSTMYAFLNSPTHSTMLSGSLYQYYGVAKVGKYQCVIFATWDKNLKTDQLGMRDSGIIEPAQGFKITAVETYDWTKPNVKVMLKSILN